jgi:glutamate--cysteine ligase
MATELLTRDTSRNFIEEHLFDPAYSQQKRKLPGETGFIGLELEAFPYTINNLDKSIRPVRLNGSTGSLASALIRESKNYGGVAKYLDQRPRTESEEPHIAIIDFPDGNSFQFEPGGQIEISTAPCDCIEAVNAQLRSQQDILSLVTQQENIHFGYFGTNPWFNVQEIGLQVNKPRFRALAHYFDGINPSGRQMMLQTCSLQVNVDLGEDDATRIKRMVAANLLAPFATALFANSSIIEGRVNGRKSYRSFIWQHLDPTRTGVSWMKRLSKTLNKDDLIDGYLDFALQAPIIYIDDFGDKVFPAGYTFEYWMANPIESLLPNITHLKNHLSLLFPEVRLKGYLELRSVDAPSPAWQMVPAMFYTGLLYSDQHLDKTLDLLLPFADQLPGLLDKASFGMEFDELFFTSKNLMRLAIEGFSALPGLFKKENDAKQLIAFFEHFTVNRKTPADEYLAGFIPGNTFIF